MRSLIVPKNECSPRFPAPPCVFDDDEVLLNIARDIERQLRESGFAYVGTHGSTVVEVAAWSVVVADGMEHASGVIGEDQPPYRAELEGIRRSLTALRSCNVSGRVVVIADCAAAISATRGNGRARKLVQEILDHLAVVRERRIVISFHWVPSHGKLAPASWVPPPCGEMQARALNAAADHAARNHAALKARRSAREACAIARREAETWEVAVIKALAEIAEVYDEV